MTGFEAGAEPWRARVALSPDSMHELRLDAMPNAAAALSDLGQLPTNTVVCCRPPRQGGRSRLDDAARVRLLRSALQQGARWIDLEADVAPSLLAGLPHDRLLLSWHDFEAADVTTIQQILTRTKGRSAGYKIALTVKDAAELTPLLDVAPSNTAVLLAMGPAGLLSRARYRHFGSAWTYVAADDGQTTAAGQLTLAQARALNLPGSARWPLLTLLGGEQVMRSPGPRVYNRVLSTLPGGPHQYLPVVTRQLERSLALLRRLGGVGASVTMPLKRDALRLAQPDALAEQVGAANTLAWREGAWFAYNSDVAGIQQPIARALAKLEPPPTCALILGTGGAAAAAVVALRRLGLHLTVAARNPDKAAAFNADAVVPFEQRAEVRHGILINATPLGGEHNPWPGKVTARVVFDMSLEPNSALLRRAREAGAITIDGLSMWCAQGAAQMAYLLGIFLDEAQLREAMV